MELFGYIDPSTGSLFIQAVFGTLLATVVVLRTNVKNMLTRAKLVLSRQPAKNEEGDS